MNITGKFFNIVNYKFVLRTVTESGANGKHAACLAVVATRHKSTRSPITQSVVERAVKLFTTCRGRDSVIRRTVHRTVADTGVHGQNAVLLVE